MKILGLDWGERKIGLAVSVDKFADPLKVVRFKSEEELYLKLQDIIRNEKIERVVVGVSEGISGKKAKEFGEKLSEKLKINVVFHDETFSTQEAQTKSQEAQIRRSKRQAMEDAYAAAVMLESYLEKN